MAQLRLGGKPQSKEAVLRVLSDGQREDGGFGGSTPGGSDLEACYRIVRVIAYFDAQPLHPEKLRTFIAKCHNADGGYGERPKTPSSLHGTYYATIMPTGSPAANDPIARHVALIARLLMLPVSLLTARRPAAASALAA